MSKITHFVISGTTDTSGDLTAYTSNVARGNIKAVKITYGSGAAATTDLLLTDEQGQTLLSLTDYNTSGWFYPRTTAQTTGGVNRVYIAAGQEIPVEFTVFSRLKAVIAQGGSTKTFKAEILVEEY